MTVGGARDSDMTKNSRVVPWDIGGLEPQFSGDSFVFLISRLCFRPLSRVCQETLQTSQ
jgi:hypothetical protein